MKIKVSKENLSSSLQKVNSIITSKSSMQILGNVLIETGENTLILTTTDLEIRIQTEIEAEIIEQGKTTLPAKKFYEIVRELNGEDVLLELNNNSMSIISAKAKFKLLGLPHEDFPLPSESECLRSFSISQNDFAKSLNLISYAVNEEDTRKALNGIFLSVDSEKITSVATDGRRLALVEKSIEDFSGENGGIIIPVKTAHELSKLLGKTGKVKVEIGDSLVTFILDNSTIITTKFIDETYPNYRQVIPISFSKNIQIPREPFALALKRVALVVSEKSFFIRIIVANNTMELSALSTDVGESNDIIPIDYDMPEMAASFNPTYLIEPLFRLDCETVTLKMNDGHTPVAMTTEDGFLYVIMPLRNK